VPWRGRFARLDDTVALWRHLWRSTGPTAYHGDVLRFEDLPEQIKPAREGGPPIWLGGFSPSALERTGRLYDGWLPYPPDPDDYADALVTVRSHGRPVTPALFATLLVTDDVAGGREALDRYTRATYKYPLEVVETVQLLIAGPLPYLRERLHPYLQAGVRHLVCRIGALGIEAQREQLELIRALDG
jgi:alkanesulfonate monooxygenase SsuD/methylene tetrahydromethanopterin reductase-like flavin-dependent oxidoreductase (luciferase family)